MRMKRPKAHPRQSGWKWYGVRSLYRITAVGRPKASDDSFDSGAALVEERVVLIRARNGPEALEKAKAEGRAYARSFRSTNVDGQKVRARMLRDFDAFEMFEVPGAGAEVFSTTEDVDAAEPDDRIVRRVFGLVSSPTDEVPWNRFKFMSRDVVQVLLAKAEEASRRADAGNEHDR
jgi:hypothetical protein